MLFRILWKITKSLLVLHSFTVQVQKGMSNISMQQYLFLELHIFINLMKLYLVYPNLVQLNVISFHFLWFNIYQSDLVYLLIMIWFKIRPSIFNFYPQILSNSIWLYQIDFNWNELNLFVIYSINLDLSLWISYG